MIIFRTSGEWGNGKGGPLAAEEIDANFYTLAQQIATITTSDTITSIEVVNNAMTILTSSGGTFGPFTLPKAMLRPRGDWAAGTAYAINDLVVVSGDGLYMVNVGHTSDATFDADKAISAVKVYWKLMDQLAGAAGAVWSPSAIGTYSGLSAHDAELSGYSYLSTDGDGGTTTSLAVVFFKNSDTSGDWSMVPFQGPAGDGSTSSAPVLSGYIAGTYASDQILYRTIGSDYYLPAALSGSTFQLTTAATADMSFAIYADGSQVGSIEFSTGGTVGQASFPSEVALASGSTMEIRAPSTSDSTGGGLTFSIPTSLSSNSGGGGGISVG